MASLDHWPRAAPVTEHLSMLRAVLILLVQMLVFKSPIGSLLIDISGWYGVYHMECDVCYNQSPKNNHIYLLFLSSMSNDKKKC